MIQKMSKVQIVGSKLMLSDVIEALHSVGTLHIESIPKKIDEKETFLKTIPLDRDKVLLRKSLEKLISRLKDILLLLQKPVTFPGKVKEGFLLADVLSDELRDRIDSLYKEVKELQKIKLELKEEHSSLIRYERILRGFAPLITTLENIRHLEVMGITIEKGKGKILPLLKEEVERITSGSSEIFERDLDEKSIGIVIAYSREYDGPLKKLLTGENISEITLPTDYAGVSFINSLKMMIKRKEEIPAELNKIESRLGQVSSKWYHLIEGFIITLDDAIEELDSIGYCVQTQYTFILSGWVPKINYSLLYSTMLSRFGDKVLIREVDIAEEEIDEVPVYIKNPFFVKPFEVFMRVFPPPKYGTIDPTPYLAFFFPVFFGLILGDMGYGIVLFLLSLYAKRRYKNREILKSIFTVFCICAMFSILFGFFFGELFGDLGERFGMHPIIMDRTRAVESFLILAIAIGVGHVLFGIVLAFVNYIQRGKLRHAMAKAASFVVVVTILLAIAIMAGYLPQDMFTPGMITLAVAFIVLIIFEGLLGPLEIIKVLGNILSYARIMAIGTASVILAMVANELGGMTGNIFLGIIVALLIHMINLVLGVFSPTIHGLRLHYVEFFSKFYQPGGRRYTPFKKHR